VTADKQPWTYVITGDVRSGAGAVISGINNRKNAVCHVDLFHADAEKRKEAHIAYFGPPASENRPEWFVPLETNPQQYINKTVFVPLREEISVGCYLSYVTIQQLELYDWMEERYREGGFGVIQIVRNPVACFVSLKQAEQSGIWHMRRGRTTRRRMPLPIRLDAEELNVFCRTHAAVTAKIKHACSDRLEISYRDLVTSYQRVMRSVFDHIELPELPELVQPTYSRLPNKPLPQRVTNWEELLREVPKDVRDLMEKEDLL